jgi:thiamine-phosphate pyrophosphorylase
MASRPKQAQPRAVPRFYLVTPPVSDPAAFTSELMPVIETADVAAVLLRLADSDPRTLLGRIKTLAPIVQTAGAALLLDGHADLVARGGADGAHLIGLEAMQETLPSLKPDRIVGCGGLHTRHDAMIAGEAGADYVLFGEPDARGERPSTDAVAERLNWWAELFEPPCVGYAASRIEARAFAAAGADFVLVADMIWSDQAGSAAALADVAAALKDGYAAAGHSLTGRN